MTFLQPLGLLGLLALPVIVLLHLLHERNRRAVIPSLAVWRWLEQQVRGPRMRRPPITPILLLQLAAAALLSLALARPRLNFLAGPAVLDRLILVIDASSSMSATDVRPSRLGRAQARAAQLVAGLGANDSAVLIAAGPHPRALADSQAVGLTGLLAELSRMQAAGVGQDWPTAMTLAAGEILPDRNNRIVLLTDGAFAFPAALEAAGYPARIDWERIGGPQANAAIVALAARPIGSGGLQVFARVANFSDRADARTATLSVDGQVFDEQAMRLSAAGTLGQVWTLPPGISTIELRLSSGDVLPADDVAALGVLDNRSVKAVLVTDRTGAVERALRSIQGLNLDVITPGDYVPFDVSHELFVFDGWLPDAWPPGAVIVFDPPGGSALLPIRGGQTAGSVLPQAGDALLRDVELDHVVFGITAVIEPPAWLAPVLTDDTGLGLIWRGSAGASRVVAFTFALDDTNITRRAAFPILISNAVAAVLPPGLPASIRPGETLNLPPAEILAYLMLTDPRGIQTVLGPDRRDVFEATSLAGLYRIEGALASGQTWRAAVGANAGALDESDLREPAAPSFAAQRDTLTGGPSDGMELWPLLAACVGLVLLVEARLAWR